MKTSYNWLSNYVSIPWEPDELAHRLTMVGLEVEDITKVNEFPRTIVTAEIISRRQHPNADKLSLCKVDSADGEILQIVCGAPNCDAGRKVVLAQIGTRMPDGGTIKKAKIRGELSYGMLCSEKELNLGNDHSGILIMPKDTPVGVPLSDYLQTDTVIDWEITPNRPDWLSHIGIAREIAALAHSPLRLPELQLKEEGDTDVNDHVSVEVLDHSLCPRYTARVIKNVEIGPSPQWMQNALKSVGLRPINNIVDITNFVLLEWGQPLHAFDLNKLSGSKICIRSASHKESLTTLDHKLLTLDSANLIIADELRGIALAGIIGGENSEITATTTDVLLESAMFDPANIRRSAKQLGVSTESSHRFERGVDIETVELASRRAARLICKYASGQLARGVVDIRKHAFISHQISCRFDRINTLLGTPIPQTTVESTLQNLGLAITKKNEKTCIVSIPSFRLDLTREIDLIEEIARCYSLERIPIGKHLVSVNDNLEDTYHRIQAARNQLISLGLQECLTNTLVSEKDNELQRNNNGQHSIILSNPLNVDLSVLRQNLLTGMLHSIAHNIAHGNADLRLFEIGRVFNQNTGSCEEHHEVCIAISGRKHPERYSAEKSQIFDFYDLMGVVEDWLEIRKCVSWQIQKATYPVLESGICAEITTKDATLGILGELRRPILAHSRIKNPVYVALLNLDRLHADSGVTQSFRPLPQFPSITRDVTFSADERLEHKVIKDTITSVGIAFLEKVELMDIFRDDERLGKGRKSMAYTLTFRSQERTLSDREVNEAQEKIRLTLIDRLPIEIR